MRVMFTCPFNFAGVVGGGAGSISRSDMIAYRYAVRGAVRGDRSTRARARALRAA